MDAVNSLQSKEACRQDSGFKIHVIIRSVSVYETIMVLTDHYIHYIVVAEIITTLGIFKMSK